MNARTRVTCLFLGHVLGKPDCRDAVRTVHPLGSAARRVPVVERRWTCTRCKRVVREDRVEPYADIGDDE